MKQTIKNNHRFRYIKQKTLTKASRISHKHKKVFSQKKTRTYKTSKKSVKYMQQKRSLKALSVVEKLAVLRSLKKTINHNNRALKSRLQRSYKNSEKCLGIDLSKQGRTIRKAIINYTASHTLNKNLNMCEENINF